MLAGAPIIAGVFLTWRLAAPPSPASLTAPADNIDMSAATVSGATRHLPAPSTVDARAEYAEPAPARPGSGPPASIRELQPSPEVSSPAAVVGSEPAPAPPSPPPADGLPLETAPPDWPVLKVQMLFYSPEIGRSFVQINGRNYRVGERLDDGPEVLEIGSHGVILSHGGKKVLLPMDR